MLDDLFSRFDRLATEPGLEKIKTIGDAYMVVAGIPEPRADHAQAIARMALDMIRGPRLRRREGARAVDPRRYPQRVGDRRRDRQQEVHLRPVGRHGQHREPLRSGGSAGAVHASETTRRRLGGVFAATPCGPVELKGVGLETWLIRPAPSRRRWPRSLLAARTRERVPTPPGIIIG